MENLGSAIVFLIICAIVITSGVFLLFGYHKTHEVRSFELIKPKIELIIKDNKVDTVYIYKNKK